MGAISSLEALSALESDIRKRDGRFRSNLFIDPKKHGRWVTEGTVYVERVSKDCALIIKDNATFNYLFYMASSVEALSAALWAITLDKPTSVDIVSRNEEPEEQIAFENVGFSVRRRLYRMTHAGKLALNQGPHAAIGCATSADAHEIKMLLDSNFDELSEQLPDEVEIEDLIHAGCVQVYRIGRQVAGFAIGEEHGLTWHLRYWFVSDEARNKGVGTALLAKTLDGNASQRQELWVVSDNQNAIRRYEHYGFKRDRLNDVVMLKGTSNK